MKPDTWRLSGCEGKASFDSFAKAEKVRGRKRRTPSAARQVYRCHWCHHFHIGRPGKKRQGRPQHFFEESV